MMLTNIIVVCMALSVFIIPAMAFKAVLGTDK